MNKVCFACPLYDMKNHFQLALNLYESKIENKIENDFYFIFSNEEHKDKFQHLISDKYPKEKIKYLITSKELDVYKAKAVTKKFFALHELMNKYDYIIITDCEAKFIKPCNYNQLAVEIWDKKTMLNSNKSPDGYFIMRSCYKTLGLYENKKLKKDTKNFSYNFWFNELQVYKTEYLPSFFEWLEKHNKDAVLNNWSCFEYYVYYAYLLLEHDIHINRFKFKSFGGINEYLYRFPKEHQLKVLKEMNLHWSSSKDAILDQTVMLFHLDRAEDDSQYVGGHARSTIIKNRIKCFIKDIIHYD